MRLITALILFLFPVICFAADGEAKPEHYGMLSIVPPLVAIVCAFIFKEVFISLFLGVYLGTLIICDYKPFAAFGSVFNDRFVTELTDGGHIKILMFTLGIAALIGVLRKSGALLDLIGRISSRIDTPRSGMVTTWASGLVIFFDDYANSLLIGNAIRPLTDKLRISREKLSYIVDATAAPIASLAISTWVGMEISLMQDAYHTIDPSVSGISLFVQSIPYRFYTVFTIFFVFFICFTDRDFGPMRKAEKRARTTGKLLAADATPMQDTESEMFNKDMKNGKWWNAAAPLAIMIAFIVGYMYYSGASKAGFDAPIQDIMDNIDTSKALMLGPVVGIIAFGIFGFKLFNIRELIENLIAGAKTVLISVFILTLAWSIASVCKDLGTAKYLISMFGDSLPPVLLPTVAFIFSAMIAFATGTSWGTMAIMFPIVIPLSLAVLQANGISPDAQLFDAIVFGTMGSILAGACWGDHSSPISDTTLFSSMATGADHIHHVRTQIPYALCVGVISLVIGYIPIALGLHWGVCLILGIAACFAVIRFLGTKNEPIG